LARAGHRVELREASDRLGGALALGAVADEPLARYLTWLERQIESLDAVSVELGAPVVAAEAAGYDEVVVATGPLWVRPPVPGGEAVRTVPELREWFDTGAGLARGPLVVLGGGKVGLTIASLARSRGLEVTVVEPSPVLVPELGLPGRFRWVADVEAAGVELLPSSELVSVGEGGVVVSTGEVECEIRCEAVVQAGDRQSSSPLADSLRAAGIACRVVGDARAVGGLEGCTHDAFDLVASLT
jgi:NADPH-dependent 2,4-dienoyl-CoA reductase/sulfur reductase-like enzyme